VVRGSGIHNIVDPERVNAAVELAEAVEVSVATRATSGLVSEAVGFDLSHHGLSGGTFEIS
jgi:hypothetical protein